MRVFIINGAPRKGGYTEELVDLMQNGVEKGGAVPDRIDLADLHIEHCRGCYTCWHPRTAGCCVIRDDMSKLLERYLDADIAVFATPLYFYSFSGLMKTFIDRLLPLLSHELEPGDTANMVHHTVRYPDRGPQKSVLMAVAGYRNQQIIDGVKSTFSLLARALGTAWAGTLFRPESFFLDFAVGKEKTLRKVRKAVETAGHELVTLGRIKPETEAMVSLPLAKDIEIYHRQTRSFWDVAMSGSYHVSSRKQVQSAVLEELSVVMPAVGDCFDKTVAGDLNAVFNFAIEGVSNGTWCFEIAQGECRVREGRHSNPDVTIETDHKTWIDIVKSKLDPRLAMTRKQLRIDGNTLLFARFNRLFPHSSS
jgi:multimeric flavodoxin WrbA/putative sterol carrier protein